LTCNDYSYAKVFWDTYDPTKRGDIKKAIEGSSGMIRSILAKELSIRHTPEIHFYYDEQFESEQNIENLLKE